MMFQCLKHRKYYISKRDLFKNVFFHNIFVITLSYTSTVILFGRFDSFKIG